MGIDVRLRGLAMEADLDAAKAALAKFDPHGWLDFSEDGRYVYVETICRYFGDSYERGNWPAIRAMLVDMQQHIPQLEYGGDCGPVWFREVCAELLAQLDGEWAERMAHLQSIGRYPAET